MKDIVFKPVDFEHRGTAYVKHHHKMMTSVKRFTTNTPCPKCGGYQRRWRKQGADKMSAVSSSCVRCDTAKVRRVEKKKGRDRYFNKPSSTLTVEQRRAIEDHQHRTNDLEDYLL
jgi:ssDNA-binding Zn-finger/Zn-ribbon topoisomerase 1